MNEYLQHVFEHTQNIGCLIKTQEKISTQTIFQGGSPWAILIFNSMFVEGVLYCVQLFLKRFFFQNPSLLSCSFPLLICFSFYFLSCILLEFSKCPISQNIGCLIKTQLKNSTQIIFPGGSPWAALIFNSIFVVVVLYCVQFFLKPFQCDLQPQIQETHRTTHTGTTTLCKTQRRNHNDRTRTRCTQEVPFIAGRSHFRRKNTRIPAPASSPKQSPCNIHAAITMRFAASHRKPARIYAHSNRAWHNHAAIPMRSATTDSRTV